MRRWRVLSILIVIILLSGCVEPTISTSKKLPYDAKIVTSAVSGRPHYDERSYEDSVTLIYIPYPLEEEKYLEIALKLKKDLKGISRDAVSVYLIFMDDEDFEATKGDGSPSVGQYYGDFVGAPSRYDIEYPDYRERRMNATRPHIYAIVYYDYDEDYKGHYFSFKMNPLYYDIKNSNVWKCGNGTCSWVEEEASKYYSPSKKIRNETDFTMTTFFEYDVISIED